MDASTGLVAGSHSRNELIIIPRSIPKPLPTLSGLICQICGDDVGSDAEGDLFVACNECGFPICRTCYDYERREGSQNCPKCKTRFKRLKGCARVPGDEDEDGIDDVENEFRPPGREKQDVPYVAHETLQDQMRYGRAGDLRAHRDVASSSRVLLLTNGEMVEDIPLDHPLPDGCTGRSVRPRPLDPSKDLASYGYGNIAWNNRMESWSQEKLTLVKGENSGNDYCDDDTLDRPLMDEARQPLSRKLPIPSSQINPYRIVIIIRLVITVLFFHYRVTHPVNDAYVLWLISVICEIWFAMSWILDQFPKWTPIGRETFLDRLSLRYEKEGRPSQLSAVDVFVSTVDPLKEPPLVTANTVLSILAIDYPVDKLSCYVSDDGAGMLTFEVLSETSEFAKTWVPFCKKFTIEPRAPEFYFLEKIDYHKDKVVPSFIKERRAMKRNYEEFKIMINALVAKAQHVPEEGWTMQDGTPWLGNNVRDHSGIIQVFLGQSGGRDIEGNELPSLVYVSREKRPGSNHHKKAGAMNALVRVSAILTNAPYILNLDCDHYINNSKALREAMCFVMDPILHKKVCYVQFPQKFDGIDLHDRYANRNIVFFDINMKGLDGIQGPIYVGTGCVFRRQSLYGFDAPKTQKPPCRTCNCWPSWCCCCFSCFKRKTAHKDKLEGSKPLSIFASGKSRKVTPEGEGVGDFMVSDQNLEKKFGQSLVFVNSTLLENGGSIKCASSASLIQEALYVISCDYEDKTDWGREVGWIYGSVTEDILTGFKMHCHGWRSVYCMPNRPAFKGSAPLNLSDRLHQVLRWALGSVEIFLSRHCPLWYGYGGGLKWLQRLSYINATVYPFTSFPLLAYCALPAVCLLTGKFITPELSNVASLWYLTLFVCIFATGILEMRWSGVGLADWWRNEQFWVIGGVSAHFFAVFQGLLKVVAGMDTHFTITAKSGGDKEEEMAELYSFKWSTLLILPTTLLLLNVVGVVAGIAYLLNNGYDSWGPLFGGLFFAFWVILHLYPFLKGFLGRPSRTPTMVIIWSILLASIFSLLWVRIDPFLGPSDGLILEECGLDCD